MTLNDL